MQPKLLTQLMRVSLILFLVISFFQCKKTTTLESIDPAFASYISAFTSGLISNQSTIKIRLAEPIGQAQANALIEEKLFEFKPEIKGQAFWIDNKTIEFRPVKLPPGKDIQGEFHLNKLLKVPDHLEAFKFNFSILKQGLELEFEGMESIDGENTKWQRVNASINSADFAPSDLLESSVQIMQNGKVLPVFWEHNGSGKTHQVLIDSIKRTEDRGQVIVIWNGKPLGFDKKEEKTIDIPPLGEFSLMDLKTKQHPEQEITLFFSDPIKDNQELEGLIYLKPDVPIKINKDRNIVKILPLRRIKGASQLVISELLRNSLNYQILKGETRSIIFENLHPAVEILGKGVILPSQNGLHLPFKAVNLSAVNVRILRIFEDNVAQFLQVNQLDGTRELTRVGRVIYKGEVKLNSKKAIDYAAWNTFSLDLSKLIQAEPGAIYRVQLRFSQKNSLFPCEGVVNNETEIDWDEEEDDFNNAEDYGYYDDYYYDYEAYNYQERDDPCKATYYMKRDRFPARNILASDLGIIAKGGVGNKLLVAVTDINTTQPQAGVEVEFYNFQQQKIGNKNTNSEGFLEIDLNKKPFFLIAKKGNARGYLRLDDGSSLSLSMFDIGGQSTKDGVKGLIYGERGVWRPGDTLYLSFILEDKLKSLPEKHPIVFELYTPQNQLFDRKIKTSGSGQIYQFTTQTSIDAPTGDWTAKVKVGGSEFSKRIKIETVKPNRLKIALNFGDDLITSNKSLNAKIGLKWLHGAIAKNLKTDVELSLSKGRTRIKGYEDYQFDDEAKSFERVEKMLYEGRVNEQGIAQFSEVLTASSEAPGMLNATFKVRAFEQSGDFSVDRFSVPYSPYRSYAGVKIPTGEGWNGALYADEPILLPVAIVDEFGNAQNRKGVKIEVFDVYWRWWWDHSSEDDLSRYVSNSSKYLIHSDEVEVKNGKLLYQLNLPKESYGRKYIRITDPASGHTVGSTFYVTYKGWWNDENSTNPGGAEMLTFTTDKEAYEPGETMKLKIPAAHAGRVLMSIETGSKIVKSTWVTLSGSEQTIMVPVTQEMAPNIFVHLTLIQAHAKVLNDLPLRLYGVQSVLVKDPKTIIEPVINMPNELAPEKEFSISVKEKTGRAMSYTLAIVDDGLLDLTRFKTPNPHGYFYAKEALSIKTWDMYKYVLGAQSGEMAGLLAIGGDEFIDTKNAPSANRFKPVVKFLGPFQLKAGATAQHKVTLPNYIGSVRTMVVAAGDATYGAAEKTTPVKKPLMVLATLPRVLGPGEQASLPVTVFAMDSKIKNVQVSIESNELLKGLDAKTQNLKFTEEGDQMAYFQLQAADKTGIAKVKVTARSGSFISTFDVELNIRPSNPRISKSINTSIEPGAKWTHKLEPVGITGTNKATLEMSNIPPINLQQRLEYLIEYPHGCLEQTTSGAFPQLFVGQFTSLNKEQEAKISVNINDAIKHLGRFQLNTGGLAYWPGGDVASDWGTSYAGHFILEAKEKGYPVSSTFLNNWVSFQKNRANNWSPDMESYWRQSSYHVQAYRLFTLALAKSPALGAMNRMRLMKGLPEDAAWRLAAAYQLIGKKETAQSLVSNLSQDVKYYKWNARTFGSGERDQAMILETLSLMGYKTQGKKHFDILAKRMGSKEWYSTQTTAFTFLAMAKFLNNSQTSSMLKFTFKGNGKDRTFDAEKPIQQIELNVDGSNQRLLEITNTGTNTLFINLNQSGIPSTDDESEFANGLILTTRYYDLAGQLRDIASVEHGSDLYVEVSVKHSGLLPDYENIALTQIFPSGWEIRNMRLDEKAMPAGISVPDYQDIRDDRVLTYFDLRRNEVKRFRVYINAAYLGRFYNPSTYCEAMYDAGVSAKNKGQWTTITAANP